MSLISRGFRRREDTDAPSDRIPPGQYVTRDFPVLSAGPTPRIGLDEWRFEIVGQVDQPRGWSWQEFTSLPAEDVTVDIHCVTKWSKLDTTWRGVSVDTLLKGVETAADYVMAHSFGGYTTNLPLEDLTGGKAWVAYEYDGEPLEPEHGGPARLLVPHLYFWKSAKWVRARAARRPMRPASGRATATTTTAIHGASSGTPATDLGDRRGRRAPRRDAARPEPHPRRPRLAGPPARAAHRRAAHRRGRLPGAAQLLDRDAGGRHPRDDHRRAPRRRRGLAVPGRCPRGRRQVELRGPIGGYFVWEPGRGGPLGLIAGGSGIVPLMAMLRARIAAGSEVPVRLLCSWRSADDVIYADELGAIARDADGVAIEQALTRSAPGGWAGRRGRLDRDALAELAWPPDLQPLTYICGPTGFVEAVASVLVELGHDPRRVLTERFGPTGG